MDIISPYTGHTPQTNSTLIGMTFNQYSSHLAEQVHTHSGQWDKLLHMGPTGFKGAELGTRKSHLVSIKAPHFDGM